MNILGRELHHIPSLETQEAKKKDELGYDKMLDLYKNSFGFPPKNIWGRKVYKKPVPMKLAMLCVFNTLLLTACTNISSNELVFYLKSALGVFFVYLIFRWLNNGSGGKGGGSSNSGGCGSSCGGGD